MNNQQKLTLEEAKKRVSIAARQYMGSFWPSEDIPVLSDEYIRGENFWMFFRNEEVYLPPEAWTQRSGAYLISDYGDQAMIADHRNSPDKLKEAIEGLSLKYRRQYGV